MSILMNELLMEVSSNDLDTIRETIQDVAQSISGDCQLKMLAFDQI